MTSRVWEKSNQRGSDLLLLLALGDRSDDDGICWPGIEELSFKTRVDLRQVKRMIKHVESMGELYVLRGIGRGHWSRYFVTTGLAAIAIQTVLEKRLKVPPLMATNLAIDLESRQKSAAGEKVTSAPPFVDCAPATPPYVKVTQRTPFSTLAIGGKAGQQKVTPETEKVTSGEQKGDILGRKIVASPDDASLLAPNHHEPSHEPPCELSHTEQSVWLPGQVSEFDYQTCERFAEQRRGINNPGGYARTICRSGEADHLIRKWLANGWREFRRQELGAIVRDLPADDTRRPLVELAITKIDGSLEDFKRVREQLLDAGVQLS